MDTRKLIGKYRGVAVDGGLGETSKGAEQVAALFELTGDGEEKGTRLTWYGSFTEKTAESTIKGLRAMGWRGTELVELLEFKKAIPKPEEVELVIEQEASGADGKPLLDAENNPTTRARIRYVNALGKIGLKTVLAADKAAAFSARMRGFIVDVDQRNGAPKNNGAPPPKASPPKQATSAEDIPF